MNLKNIGPKLIKRMTRLEEKHVNWKKKDEKLKWEMSIKVVIMIIINKESKQTHGIEQAPKRMKKNTLLNLAAN